MTDDDIKSILADLTPEPLSLVESARQDAAALFCPPGEGKFSKYRYDALGYFRDVLKAKFLSEMQKKYLHLISQPADEEWHRKLAVGTGINFGKSWLGGGTTNWYYDSWGPCLVPTTAPSQQSVKDLLWKEVRLQRIRADAKWSIGTSDFIGPQATEMRRAPDWWARGYVAAKGENFKGRHVENMCFLFDEAVGLMELYFRMTKTMFKPNTSHLWVCFYNPTDTASPMYQEINRPDSDWMVLEMSSLEHPNVLAGLRGEELPIPAAVSLEQLEEGIKDDCEPVDIEDKTATDFEWPPASGRWWKPGPSFEGEYLGRWPSSDETALWSDALWKAITKPLRWEDAVIPVEEIPRIGCDVAYMGAAKTSIHVVWGDYSIHQESKGGQQPMRTVGRLVELADEWAEKCNKERLKHGMQPIAGKNIPIKVDDTGIGGGVVSRLRELRYNVWAVGAAEKAMRMNRYPNKRSELWFMTRDRAKLGKVHLGLLPYRILVEMRKQAFAPLWSLNSAGQREVERKELTEARLGTSVDLLDGMNLGYYLIDLKSPEIIKVESQGFMERHAEAKEQREGPRWSGRGKGRGRPGLFRR